MTENKIGIVMTPFSKKSSINNKYTPDEVMEIFSKIGVKVVVGNIDLVNKKNFSGSFDYKPNKKNSF